MKLDKVCDNTRSVFFDLFNRINPMREEAKSKFHCTHCAARLGDNLHHLHFLRKLAEKYEDHRFLHFAHPQYLGQLEEIVWDQPRISLLPLFKSHDPNWLIAQPPWEFRSVNAWKNAGGYWASHPDRLEYVTFMVLWFRRLAEHMELESPIKCAADLLFDYPALRSTTGSGEKNFDFLIINSPALSGQSMNYDLEEMDALILELAAKYTVITTHKRAIPVRCTADDGLTVTGIGRLSQHCRFIVMVSTGPSWMTFNIWNSYTVKSRIVIIDNEVLDLAPNTIHASSVSAVRETLMKQGVL
jgi:hypothetical protein